MDTYFIRKQFSALNENWILFENAGGTQVPDAVLNSVRHFFLHFNVQPGQPYPHSQGCDQVLQDAHEFVADWIGAPGGRQIVFGPSATALNRLMSISLLQRWRAGDEIIVTISDHEANVNPWVFLQKFGLKVKFWPINRDSYELELDDLKKLLTDRTVLVAFPYISNILGTENPVQEITRLSHDAGALVYVDGVASSPHTVIDVQSWDVDFYVFSTYKTFGPHMAALYGKADMLLDLERANHFFLPNEIPLKFELGTPNLEGCAALLGVEQYLNAVLQNEQQFLPKTRRQRLQTIMRLIHQYEIELAWRLIDGLQQLPGVQIIGLTDPQQRERRVPVVAFTLPGHEPEEIVRKLADQQIALGSGHFYAYRLIDFLGLLQSGGVLRASLVHYNTAEEIERFLAELEKLL